MRKSCASRLTVPEEKLLRLLRSILSICTTNTCTASTNTGNWDLSKQVRPIWSKGFYLAKISPTDISLNIIDFHKSREVFPLSSHTRFVRWAYAETNGGSAELNPNNPEDIQIFTNFWRRHISAVNPEPHWQLQPEDEHSAIALAPCNQHNTISHLSAVLNHVQKHYYSDIYYLQKEKASGEIKYQFYYLIPLQETPTASLDLNLSFLYFQLM